MENMKKKATMARKLADNIWDTFGADNYSEKEVNCCLACLGPVNTRLTLKQRKALLRDNFELIFLKKNASQKEANFLLMLFGPVLEKIRAAFGENFEK